MKEQLFAAIRKEQANEVDRLLQEGADVNAADDNLETPLMKAIINDSIPLVRVIVKYNPDLTCKNDLGLTIKDFLQESKNNKIFSAFIYPPQESHADEKELTQKLLEDMHAQKKQLETKYMLLEQKKTNIESVTTKESLKQKAFFRLLSGGIRDCFTISKKIENNSMQRTPSSSGTVISTLNQVAPVIEKQFHVDGLTSGMQLVSVFSSIYDHYSKKKEGIEAARFTKAFSNDFGQINDNTLENVVETISKRYADQLQQLTLSTSFSSDHKEIPDIRPGDGLYVFTTAIINRIVSSIIRGQNEFYPKRFLSKEEKIPMPVIQRCIKALYQENWDENMNKEILTTEQETNPPWIVGGVLDRTGIKILSSTSEHNFYYADPGFTKHHKYGFCIGTEQEIHDRSLKLIVQDQKENKIHKNNSSQNMFNQNKQGRHNYQALPDTDIKPRQEETCCCIIA